MFTLTSNSNEEGIVNDKKGKTREKKHSLSQVIPNASFRSSGLTGLLSHCDIRLSFVLHVCQKSPEPGLNCLASVVWILAFFPQFIWLQTLSESDVCHPALSTLCHLPSCWISTLPAHRPGPSTNLTSTLSVL